jgi:hypothetical protein
MIAFDVYLNGKKLCRAGINETGVLTGHVMWLVQRKKGNRRKSLPAYMDVSVTGLETFEEEDAGMHLRWANRRLKVGDSVRFVVVEAAKVDRPKARYGKLPSGEVIKPKRPRRKKAGR